MLCVTHYTCFAAAFHFRKVKKTICFAALYEQNVLLQSFTLLSRGYVLLQSFTQLSGGYVLLKSFTLHSGGCFFPYIFL
jgi:hypothetical protein